MVPPSNNENRNNRVSISNEEVQDLPLLAYSGKVAVVTTPEALTKALSEARKSGPLGFDTETRPAFVKGQRFKVALIQLASMDKVWLIRTQSTGYAEELIRFLEDESVLKIGVGLRDDLQALHRVIKFQPGGFVELTQLTKTQGIEVESVKKLCGLLLGYRVSKSAQTSNWEAATLTEKQIEYAATDAWVCLLMYNQLPNLK
ncbi:MAG: 3'-5' exonuclease domain-containing protein 2 [Cyclobacteriaceae bacterium]|nr:3'-5' exonuclease domain-containing protein 2 [Cyclobacteriaceae bacterium]